MTTQMLSSPSLREIRTIGCSAGAIQPLTGDRVVAVRTPLKVRTDDAIVAVVLAIRGILTLVQLAVRGEHPDEGQSYLALDPRDEIRVSHAGRFAGHTTAPVGRGDGPRVHRLDRRLKQVGALEKEGTLLGKEQGKPLVRGNLRRVGLLLRKVGIVGGNDGIVR